MELTNAINKYNEEVDVKDKNPALLIEVTTKILQLLSPIAPFITEELWHLLGISESIHKQNWPSFDEMISKQDLVTVVFQVNGKLRDKKEVPAQTPKEELEKEAFASEKIQRFIEGKQILKKIVVPDKLVNIVIR
jgi:leucyl-tRNA synthetase